MLSLIWDLIKTLWYPALIIAVLLGLVAVSTKRFDNIEKLKRHEFMTNCLVEHTEYECDALWRQGKVDLAEYRSGGRS